MGVSSTGYKTLEEILTWLFETSWAVPTFGIMLETVSMFLHQGGNSGLESQLGLGHRVIHFSGMGAWKVCKMATVGGVCL